MWGDMIDDEELVNAMLHVAYCERGLCGVLLERLDGMLEANTHFNFVTLGALSACREDLRWRAKKSP